MNRRFLGIALLTMLPVAAVVALIVWLLTRRQDQEVKPRSILVEKAAPRPTAEATGQIPAREVAPPAAEVQAKTTPAKTTRKADDLKVIEGIGPKVAELLSANGIRTFAQLGRASQKRLESILDEANLRFIKPATWPEQAGLAASGDWEALDRLKAELKGGTRAQ